MIKNLLNLLLKLSYKPFQDKLMNCLIMQIHINHSNCRLIVWAKIIKTFLNDCQKCELSTYTPVKLNILL